VSLFIRDPEVSALAEELRRLTHAGTKTEAVKLALKSRIDEARRALPIEERLARAHSLADAMGPSDPTFDMKRFTDEMWGDD
jgi:antitoxin VapB